MVHVADVSPDSRGNGLRPFAEQEVMLSPLAVFRRKRLQLDLQCGVTMRHPETISDRHVGH
jgi:hypothetical protein